MPVPAVDWPSVTDGELAALRDAVAAEQVRRYALASAGSSLAAIEQAAQAAPEAVRDQIRDRLDQVRGRLDQRSARG